MRRRWISTIPATVALAAFALAPAGCGGDGDSETADLPDVSAGEEQTEATMESAQAYADDAGRELRQQITERLAEIEDRIDRLDEQAGEENVVSRQAEMARERLEELRDEVSEDASKETLRNVADEARELSEDLEEQLRGLDDTI